MVPDPQRIVVLAGDELDALCALGLQSRVVAAAIADGATGQPSYLGTVIHDVPGAGTRTNPDFAAIAAAKPDLILGSAALTRRPIRSCRRSPRRCSPRRRARVAGQPAHHRRGHRPGGGDRRTDRRIHRPGPPDRCHRRRPALPGLDRAVHRHHPAGVRRGELPGQRARECRRGSPCGATVHRQALPRDRGLRRRPGPLTRPVGRRRRHHLPVVRVTGSQAAHRRSWKARRGARAVPTATTGCSSSATRCGRLARASSPAASPDDLAG